MDYAVRKLTGFAQQDQSNVTSMKLEVALPHGVPLL